MSRILLLTTIYPSPGRPGTDVCHFFVKEWIKMGHQVIVVHMRSCFPAVYQRIANRFPGLTQNYLGAYLADMSNREVVEYEMDGVRVYGLPLVKIVPHFRITRKCAKETLRIIQEKLRAENWRPDAILGHFTNPQLELIPQLKKLYPEARTSLVLHSSDIPGQIKRNYPFSFKKLLASFDCIGYRSVSIRDRFEKAFGKNFRFFHCYSGIPADFVSSETVRTFSDTPLKDFLYVGQFIRRKYPQEVMSALLDVYGKESFNLTYVGKKNVLFDDLVRYAEHQGIQDRVHFAGKVAREQVVAYYDAADCFVMISRDETFGLVYLEAMSRGCLVIASRGEGMEGIIENGKNGFLCAAGDAVELAATIRKINAMDAAEKTEVSRQAVLTARRMTDAAAAKDYYNHVFNIQG